MAGFLLLKVAGPCLLLWFCIVHEKFLTVRGQNGATAKTAKCKACCEDNKIQTVGFFHDYNTQRDGKGHFSKEWRVDYCQLGCEKRKTKQLEAVDDSIKSHFSFLCGNAWFSNQRACKELAFEPKCRKKNGKKKNEIYELEFDTPSPTKSPTTPEPTKSPTTPEPTTPEPTRAPTTPEPTRAPTTPEPTKAPTTPEPTTPEPTTSKPTKAPTTPEPTRAPTTPKPSKAPTTPEPTKADPTLPQGPKGKESDAKNDESSVAIPVVAALGGFAAVLIAYIIRRRLTQRRKHSNKDDDFQIFHVRPQNDVSFARESEKNGMNLRESDDHVQSGKTGRSKYKFYANNHSVNSSGSLQSLGRGSNSNLNIRAPPPPPISAMMDLPPGYVIQPLELDPPGTGGNYHDTASGSHQRENRRHQRENRRNLPSTLKGRTRIEDIQPFAMNRLKKEHAASFSSQDSDDYDDEEEVYF